MTKAKQTTQATQNGKMALDKAVELFQGVAQNESVAELSIEHIKSLCKVGAIDWAHHKTIRTAYVKTRQEVTGCTSDAASKAWERLCSKVGYKAPKSTSAAAVKKAEQRAAKKASEPAKPTMQAASAATATQDKTTPSQIVPPLDPVKSAIKTKMDVIAIEAHIVTLWRQGNFKAIIDICHKEAEKTKP